jgi:voltage-gated potassium channel
MTQEKWRRIVEWPLVGASVLFLIAYAWDVIGDYQGRTNFFLQIVMWAVWVPFLADYVVMLVLARSRWRWFYRHLFDLAIVALPFLRPLRLLRLFALLAVLRRAAGTALRGRVIIYTVATALLLILVAALAELSAEQNAPGATIRTFPEAVWWAFVTITTVGYGDYTPVTETGRLVAVGLMVSGIALLGIVTATIASWFVEQVQTDQAAQEILTTEHIQELVAEIGALRTEIAGLRREVDGSGHDESLTDMELSTLDE